MTAAELQQLKRCEGHVDLKMTAWARGVEQSWKTGYLTSPLESLEG